MMFRRDWFSWLLIALAVACFVAALFPEWSKSVDPASGDKLSECRLGLWFSPFFLYSHHEHAQGFRTQTGINWVSWSSLVILVGLGSLRLLRWRQARRSSKPTPNTPTPHPS
jgi:hypothetical protein